MFNYTKKSSITQPFFNQSGKVIGKLEGGVLKKIVRGSIHMLQKPRGWALDKEVIEKAEKKGGKLIIIKDIESDTTYRASFEDFNNYGIDFNRGFGAQIVLPIRYWEKDEMREKQASLF